LPDLQENLGELEAEIPGVAGPVSSGPALSADLKEALAPYNIDAAAPGKRFDEELEFNGVLTSIPHQGGREVTCK
jgi:hypothetical protein